MKRINKLLSALLAIVLMLTAMCSVTANADAVNTFMLSTSYEDGIIADNATQVVFNVKFDVGSSYGFVGGDFTLELPDKINDIALVKVTAATKLGGGAANKDLVATAVKNDTVRFIYDDAKASLKSISFEITLNIVSTLERGDNYEIRVLALQDSFKDDQSQNEAISFETDTKSFVVRLRRTTAAKPSRPAVIEEKTTDTSVTLIDIVGNEYRCGNGPWQTSNVFTGLSPNTQYYFYQRKAETSSQFASESSDATLVRTLKSTPVKPAVPTLSGKTATSVTLKPTAGYEYKRDGGNWQESNVFEGLSPNKTYYFYQRVAESEIYYAGASSNRLAVTTDSLASPVPDKITSSKYRVTDSGVSKISAGVSVSTFLNGINEKQYCKVYSGNKALSGDKTVGTGMTVKLLDGNKVKASYTITVTGDVNGDGKITAADYVNVKFSVLGKQTLNGAYRTAADVNGDNKITAVDYVNIKFKVLGKTQITPR